MAEISAPFSPLPPGTRIGPYVIVRHIPGGVGGMAAVYEARLHGRGPSVALKVAHAGLGAFLKDETAFLKALRLNHPHIIRILSVPLGDGTSDYIVKDPETGCWYFVMEYMAGGSLADWLSRRRRIPVPQAVEVVRQIGSALDAAHQAGILHLDVKPSNILFRTPPDRGRLHAVLTDFGIARPHGRAATAQTTLTVEYASPEQARLALGETVSLGPASDLYSLGVVFYEMITGHLPFQKDDDHALLRQVVSDRPDLHEVPAPLVPVLERALSKSPEERFPTGAEMASALEEAARNLPAAPARRPRAWAPVAVGLALGLLIGFPSGWYLGRQSTGRSSETTTPVVAPATATPLLRLSVLPTQAVTPTRAPATPTRRPTSTPLPPTPTAVPRPAPTATPSP